MSYKTNRKHKNSQRRHKWALVMIGIFFLAALPSHASHSVFVSVPGHAEEALNWCGPAAGQMAMGGYPASACTTDQSDVAVHIQNHQVELNWDADPAGLQAAMMEMCPPSFGWDIFANPNAQSLMFWVAYWMTRFHYPVVALLSTNAHNSDAQHQEHWVTITGIVTDVDPTTPGTTSVNLQSVTYIDQPTTLGPTPETHMVLAADWYNEFLAVTKMPSAYNGKFVAIIEPPTANGLASAAEKPVLTGKIVPKDRVSHLAVQAVRDFNLPAVEAFRELAQARPLEPYLVNPARGGYYLVPFSANGKSASWAVLINAYTGKFAGAAHFAPRAYLPVEGALEQVNSALRLRKPLKPKEVEAVLLSSPEEGTRFHPEWQIMVGNRTLRVGQRGQVHELPPQRAQRPQRH